MLTGWHVSCFLQTPQLLVTVLLSFEHTLQIFWLSYSRCFVSCLIFLFRLEFNSRKICNVCSKETALTQTTMTFAENEKRVHLQACVYWSTCLTLSSESRANWVWLDQTGRHVNSSSSHATIKNTGFRYKQESVLKTIRCLYDSQVHAVPRDVAVKALECHVHYSVHVRGLRCALTCRQWQHKILWQICKVMMFNVIKYSVDVWCFNQDWTWDTFCILAGNRYTPTVKIRYTNDYSNKHTNIGLFNTVFSGDPFISFKKRYF